jgi:hypothetical protein
MNLPGRYIRSAMNGDNEDSMSTNYDLIGNQTNGIQNNNITEDQYTSNDTINHKHTVYKRLDPSVDQDDGQPNQEENQSKDLQNWASIDYPSIVANDSILDHRQIINLLQRHNRQGKNNGHLPRVKIHNIISGLPKPEIEMLYAVYQGTDVTN